ncbi:uncharacterized protein LOC132740860 isoform X2 [Ruditapes philippinarum]|uniref:uncharacterized protein LOC132740860 isoform X2 n=1 Tax=Ruditapes philippinarum TaxID=129788 RepID=UPI00295B1E02|nr:uncharacterized protein LOC132740860 isoform X2 [Ruditapes philippinarum]
MSLEFPVNSSWQPDQEAQSCPLCKVKFGGLKRRHHCRQCGHVVCNKCCNVKIPLPQLAIEEPEKICESCQPVTAAVTRSRSHLASMQLQSAVELSGMCKSSVNLTKVFEYGGFHTLLAQSKVHLDTPNMNIMTHIISALHTLSTCEPVQDFMVDTGIIRAICQVLDKVPGDKEQILLDGISSLVIYCKSKRFLPKVLEAGYLQVVLRLCCNTSDTVAVLSVSTLSLLVEDPSTHTAIIDGDKAALQRILKLAAAENPQMQAVALKCLNYLSMGSDWNKHRIIQEDFTAGKPMKTALQTETFNMQVWANAACLVANLATSAEDQAPLSDCLDCLVRLLKSDMTNVDLLSHVTRGLANFAKFPQNSSTVGTVLPTLVSKCLNHTDETISKHALRAILHLLVNQSDNTITELLIEGASEVFKNIARNLDMTDAMFKVLQDLCPDMARPL